VGCRVAVCMTAVDRRTSGPIACRIAELGEYRLLAVAGTLAQRLRADKHRYLIVTRCGNGCPTDDQARHGADRTATTLTRAVQRARALLAPSKPSPVLDVLYLAPGLVGHTVATTRRAQQRGPAIVRQLSRQSLRGLPYGNGPDRNFGRRRSSSSR
jgi:hypothetical protein